ncbi:ComEC/Rec2 family competence protein [Flavobacterium sp. J27]|uniref:ComEC/Rec2 family competence protein n=1 Tax=Flavobacterium sp. J27 TaxID=2060419 RepID=UPI00102F7876|nr:ComEC/Rec2 family competence protein [Flavobacterium sp. J27]
MKFFKFPIITLTASYALGIIFENHFSLNLTLLCVVTSIFFVLFLLAFYEAKKQWFQNTFFGITSYCLIFSLGTISHYFHTDIYYNNHYSNFSQENKNLLIGAITSELKPSATFDKYILEVEKCNTTSSFGKLLLYVKKDGLKLHVGERIKVEEKIMPTLTATNPYQFDYGEYLKKQNIYHQVFCEDKDVMQLGFHKGGNYYLQRIREKGQASFDYHGFSKETKSILNALLFGQRTTIDQTILTNYSNSGVVHILAISGLHVGILFFFFSFVLKPLEKLKKGKLIKLLLVLGLLWLFALLTGLPASVTRAVTLFSFVSLGNHFNKQNNVFNAVAVSALFLLLFNPNYIFDIGFQLSYAAVISILLLQPFYEKFYFTKNKIGIYFTDIILVSLAAQVGVLPLSLYYFHQFPLLFLLANVVVIPMASLVMILGSILLVVNLIFKPLGLFLGKLVSFCVEMMNNYIAFIAHFEKTVVKNISFSNVTTILLYLVIIAFIYWLYQLKWHAFRIAMFAVLLFQMTLVFSQWNSNQTEECIVYNSKETLISKKMGNEVCFYTNETTKNERFITDYMCGSKCHLQKKDSLKNVLSYNKCKILLVDSMVIYDVPNAHIDYVILIQSPKLNLSRLIQKWHPKQIIADNTNAFYLVNQWKATCRKENIPFHATAEKGYFTFK